MLTRQQYFLMSIRVLWSLLLVGGALGCDGAPILGSSSDGGMDALSADVGCAAPQQSCGGRCVDPSVDPSHCGACGNACASGQACVAGRCELRCPGVQAVCAGQCINLQTDNAHCGACGRACPGGQVCSLGRCATTCDPSLAACGGGDGGVGATSCVDTRTDRLHCGGCGNACSAGHVCIDRTCQLSCATGQRDCSGTCRDLQNDNAHCGACGTACPAGNTCVAGACAVSCGTGLTQCGAACANLQTDNANCGACGTTCPAGQVCSGGRCSTTCAAPLATCGTAPSVVCADTAIDPAHCGGCGRPCALANTMTQGCTSGACAVVRCAMGYGDCDGAAANGCETDTRTSVSHCGGCGRACALPHATASCAASACAVMACEAGFSDCDRVASNGCEVDTRSDNANCGACGAGCAAGQVCSGGVCGATCASPLRTCGAAPTAFCANTAIDPTNCGACGSVCSLPNVATHGCAGGVCAPTRCAAGFGDCDSNGANGCETNTQTNAASCGACGRACALPNATATCALGACAVAACTPGFVNCDGNPANGCEVDTRSDNANCGACGTACAAGQVCSGGMCGTTCASPLRTCGAGGAAFCANTAIDPANCGGCAMACALAGVAANGCAAGACTVVRCNTGAGDCDGNNANGCETNTQTSVAHCGACGRGCALPNATATCAGGACAVASCATGFADCDNNPANGCEVDTRSDNASCGMCGRACAGGTMCSAGACGVTCQTGQSNCSGTCANLGSDPRHCGACGMPCATGPNATAYCAASNCGIACAANFADCDGMASTGCEVDTRSSAAHCGGCGRACATGQLCSAGACACPMGQRLLGGACVGDGAPRPLAPMSLGDVTQRRPTLRWALPVGFTGAAVELCRDRACTMVLETLTVSGSSARPVTDLPARSVVFWRVRARVGGVTDTAYSPTWLFHVPAMSASSGVDTSLTPHFDVNADGYDDLVVGAYLANVGTRIQAGNVRVFHGGVAGIGATAARFLESETYQSYGTSVANAGDVNGDGYADLAVGVPSSFAGGPRAGGVSVYHGGPSGIGPTAARHITGTLRGAELGYSVSSAGDVNGDGYADLIAGGYNADLGGRTDAGMALVFHGSATGVVGTAARVLEGSAASDAFGFSVSGLGDVNGDGFSDVAVSALRADPGGRTDAGSVSVFHGGASGVGATAAAVVEGLAAGDSVGTSVSDAGDLNGDGYADLIVGGHNAVAPGISEAGVAMTYHGGAAGIGVTAVTVWRGSSPGQEFGRTVGSAGDVNGDGYADVIVGAWNTSGAPVFHGSASGAATTASQVIAGQGNFAFAVTGIGDANGDGYDDVVLGSPLYSPGGQSFIGSARVHHGSAVNVSATPVTVLLSNAEGDFFGSAVACFAPRGRRYRASTTTLQGPSATPPVWDWLS